MSKVTFQSITHPSDELKELGITNPEELIVYFARVSNPSNQFNTNTSDKLLNYLIRHKHWSPFEMVSMTVEIVTTRAIAAQLLRHRSFSFQEASQRYMTASSISSLEIRKQAEKNRQSSSEEFDPIIDNKSASELVSEYFESAMKLYSELVTHGVAKESARMILPLGTETRLFMSGTIRSWIHYLEIRCQEDTQKEHRDIAIGIRNIFSEKFPLISNSLQIT
jgi:thymidylate synthase (FAD)